jgi:hypothetical protein
MSRLQTIWSLLNLPCEGITRLGSRSLDCDLAFLERIGLHAHLLYCRACRRYMHQLKLGQCALRRLARRVEAGEPLPGPGLPEDVRERIKRALKGY